MDRYEELDAASRQRPFIGIVDAVSQDALLQIVLVAPSLMSGSRVATSPASLRINSESALGAVEVGCAIAQCNVFS
jgi:hypothetical protein